MTDRDKKKPAKNSLPQGDPGDGTRIDLGDDLLDKTAQLEYSRPSEEVEPAQSQSLVDENESIDSQLHSARILVSEGLLEEAKRIFRKVLIQDSDNLSARQGLEELHKEELKQIFNNDRTNRHLFGKKGEEQESATDRDVILEKLDRDLNLDLHMEGLGALEGMSLFGDKAAFDTYAKKLDEEFSKEDSATRIDLGIGFLEMGLFELAARQFEAALHKLEQEANPELVVAIALLAYARILGNKPLEATMAIQPLLNDGEIPREKKVELFYLMGRANEALKSSDLAARWYRQVEEIEPDYRDVRARLKTREPG